MLVLLFTGCWYLLLVAMTVAAALQGRAAPEDDRAQAYERDRHYARQQHQLEVRQEELAEMRRREGGRRFA